MKPSIPKGTRDFSPIEMSRRNYIFSVIRSVFSLYGFRQIETPAMENLSTLMGKYGEEGDKLLFKILNSGDWASALSSDEIAEKSSNALTSRISEKGLRYDLTVPFARYVVQHREEIAFPFKRFQIQPVWRADRPQRGRYREFFQCDADVVGSNSLIYEAELIEMMDLAFTRFGINVVIKINNRKILAGIAEYIGHADKIIDITVAIDKLDKIGLGKVKEELSSKGIEADAIALLDPILNLKGTNEEKIAVLRSTLASNELAMKGLDEIEEVFAYVADSKLRNQLQLDLTLARGLNYYTGAIFEVKALDVEMGSISGGGRYDNLTGIFGLEGVSGVGFSFGADRIYDVLTELNLFPKDVTASSKVIFLTFDHASLQYARRALAAVRQAGIAAEIYPEPAKMKKQMSYVNAMGINFAAIVGENEMNNNTFMLKDMSTGEQKTVDLIELIQLCK